MPQHHSDVIGSLLRPKYLTRARDDYAAGQRQENNECRGPANCPSEHGS